VSTGKTSIGTFGIASNAGSPERTRRMKNMADNNTRRPTMNTKAVLNVYITYFRISSRVRNPRDHDGERFSRV
jgi:hypothetical protein